MSSQPVLVVIGIAIVVNLVIMGALLAMLVVRRRPMAAAGDDRGAGARTATTWSQGAPTAVGPVTYMSDESDQSMGAMDDDYQLAPDPTGVFRDPAPNPATPGRIETRIDDFYRAEGVPGDPAGAEPVPVPAPGEAITAGGPLAGSPTPAPVPAGPAFPAAATATTPEPSVATASPDPVGPIGHRPVTGLDGPVVFDGRIRDEDARFSRYRRPVSVVLIELDGLDRLGDLLGPDARTRILRPVGQSIRRQARATDYIARIGDGRFAALLPETDEVQAINFVERVRTECDRWLASGARLDAPGDRLVEPAARQPAERRHAGRPGPARSRPAATDRRLTGPARRGRRRGCGPRRNCSPGAEVRP